MARKVPMAEDTNNGAGGNSDSVATQPDTSGTQVNIRPIAGAPPPPDNIFKYVKNRTAPSEDSWGSNGSVSYIPYRAEYIEGKGNFVYYDGVFKKKIKQKDGTEKFEHIPLSQCDDNLRARLVKDGWMLQPPPPFPSKTMTPIQAVYAIGTVKRAILMDLYLFSALIKEIPIIGKILFGLGILVMGKKRRTQALNDYVKLFNEKHDMVLVNFYLGDGYYCPVVKEIRKFVQTTLISLGVEEPTAIKTGEIIGMLFENDNAYRMRIQDLLGEASWGLLINDFPSELKRLIGIQVEREVAEAGGHVVQRFQSAEKMVKYLWKVPSIKHALQDGIDAINLENCKMDEADIYHSCLYKDYDFQGKNMKERIKILEGYHGPINDDTWPPRMFVFPQGTTKEQMDAAVARNLEETNAIHANA